MTDDTVEPDAMPDDAPVVDTDENLPDPDGSEALGDPGKKALAEMKSKWQAERAAAKKAAAERDALLAQIESGNKTPEEQALEEARREARAEATAKANERIVRANLRAAAAGLLADPSDALAFIDISQFDVDDDGEVDSGELGDAIEDLLKRKPHLAAGKPNPFGGGADGGAGAHPEPQKSDEEQLDALIAKAQKDRDIALVATLKQQKAALAKKG